MKTSTKFKKLSQIFDQVGYKRLSAYVLQDKCDVMFAHYVRLVLVLDRTGTALKTLFENDLI